MARQRSQQTDRDRQESGDRRRRPGRLYVVGTPIGSPGDVTIRALATFRRVSIIASESPRATQTLLARHGITATITSYGPDNLEERIAVLLHYLGRGRDLALVSDNGMPVIYDPGQRLIAAAHERGYPVSVIPGPSALTAAVALSGYAGDRIVFEGRLPATGRRLDKFFAPYKRESGTMVFPVSSRALVSVLRSLARICATGRLTLAVDMTKRREQLYRGTPAALLGRIRSIPPDADITLVMQGNPQRRRWKRSTRPRRRATRRSGGG